MIETNKPVAHNRLHAFCHNYTHIRRPNITLQRQMCVCVCFVDFVNECWNTHPEINTKRRSQAKQLKSLLISCRSTACKTLTRPAAEELIRIPQSEVFLTWRHQENKARRASVPLVSRSSVKFQSMCVRFSDPPLSPPHTHWSISRCRMNALFLIWF